MPGGTESWAPPPTASCSSASIYLRCESISRRCQGGEIHRVLDTFFTCFADSTDVRADVFRLATCVDELRRQRFRRYWSAARVQRAVLDFLYAASDGGFLRRASLAGMT